MKPPLRVGAARFPLWAAIAAEFGAFAGQKAAQEPQCAWDVPWYRSFGVLAAYAVREGYSATTRLAPGKAHQLGSMRDKQDGPLRADAHQSPNDRYQGTSQTHCGS